MKKFTLLFVLILCVNASAIHLNIWAGGTFNDEIWNDTVVAIPGGWVEVPVYLEGDYPSIWMGELSFPLAIKLDCFDAFDSSECQLHYPFSEWEFAYFINPNDEYHPTYPTPAGYIGLSFLGIARDYTEEAPWFHSYVPLLGFSFRVHAVSNADLIGQVVDDALARGADPFTGQLYAYDTLGSSSFYINDYYACIYFESGYQYVPGDVNMHNGTWPPLVIGGDVTYLVNYFKGMSSSQPCPLDGFWASADANGDYSIIGGDVIRLVNYFRGNASISYCSEFPPDWLTPDSVPDTAPAGWPNCGIITNHAPALNPIGAQYIVEDEHLELRITAIDSDGDPIDLYAELLPTNADFQDSTGGVGGFTFDPVTGQAGEYQVRFIASDGSLADTELVSITVAVGNHPPEWDPISSQIVVEGEHLEVRVTASDPDLDPLNLSAELLPTNADFQDSTGGVGGFIFDPAVGQADDYQVRFIVTDGELSDTELVDITVVSGNQPPVWDPIASPQIDVGDHLELRVVAADINNDSLILSAEMLPDNSSFHDSTDGVGGFIFDPDSSQVGIHQVRFIVADGELSDTELVDITVDDTTSSEAIIADHTFCGSWQNIPDSIVQAITNDYEILYLHTSHGSQIMSGLDCCVNADPLYIEPYFREVSDDLGHNGDTLWVPTTRNYLESTSYDFNMAMFSWCGGCSDNDSVGIYIYLNKMEELEADYPDITFIYMTGHLDGSGPSGTLYQNNNWIRDYCNTHDKILFDFADIESYDPDGNYYPNETDYCNWCTDWCASHSCPSCGCAHSQCFNCYQKGKAWWVMMARHEGWTGE